MKKSMLERISESRKLYENPYAYLDATGNFTATAVSASTDEIVESRRLLLNQYAHLDGDGEFSALANRKTGQDRLARTTTPTIDLGPYAVLARAEKARRSRRDRDIEAAAISLQKLMWADRTHIWSTARSSPCDLLDPETALELFGYRHELCESLGYYYDESGKQIEVAGVIDNEEHRVKTSRRFPGHIRKFTAAHELGHALMHEERGLHRDRPIDGTSLARDAIEYEADKFAAYFLMPRKLLTAHFKDRFGTDSFTLGEGTWFALARGASNGLLKNCSNSRELGRILSAAESYNGRRFISLSNQFGVSVETMAIRLEELKLFQFGCP